MTLPISAPLPTEQLLAFWDDSAPLEWTSHFPGSDLVVHGPTWFFLVALCQVTEGSQIMGLRLGLGLLPTPWSQQNLALPRPPLLFLVLSGHFLKALAT